MEFSKCIVCLSDCLPRSSIKKTEEILDGLTHIGDPVQTPLNAIFLLKKILRLPENVTSEFSQKYGDPNLWIDCCESCLILVEKLNHISKEIVLLEEQFKKVQCKIKDKIVQSDHSEEELKKYFNSDANNFVRSYVCQAFGNNSTEVPFEDVKLENAENSSECILGYQTLMSPAPDNEFSDIDSDDDEEKRPHQIIGKTLLNWDTEIENSVEFTENDYDDNNIYVSTADFKEEEQAYDSTENEERINCIKEISKRKTFKCVKCCETFSIEAKLDHSCKNNSGKEVSCGSGDVRLNHPADFQVHTAETSFKCELCEKMFPKMCALNTHIKGVHNGRPFKCKLCERCFPKLINLNRHVKTVHNGEKPFQCELCEKRFSEKNNLKMHVRTVHNGEKPYKCNVCGKRFPQMTNLNKHVRSVHNGERPYQCELCQKWYSDKGALNIHIKRVHNSERPFKCDICEERFKNIITLKRHVSAVHNGERPPPQIRRPFKCDVCDKLLGSKGTLTYHLKVIHNIWNHINP